jgi:type IV pilus assembly protein PilE
MHTHHHHNTHRKPIRGFSLPELLIALSIVGILGAMALPSYRQSMQRATRQEAHLALLRLQVQQEQYFIEHLRYAERLASPPDAQSLALSPLSDHGAYELSLQTDADGRGYTALAHAQGRQSADRDCAVLTLDHTGRRGSIDAQGNHQLTGENRCWN